MTISFVISLLAGADLAIKKGRIQTICPHSNALIVQKKGGSNPQTPTPLIRHCPAYRDMKGVRVQEWAG